MRAIQEVVEIVLIHPQARSAVKYVDPKLVVKATRRTRHDKRDRHIELVLSVGRPNYAEREFVKMAKKAGEPFPVKKVQVKFENR
jgi:hypothetical protein